MVPFHDDERAARADRIEFEPSWRAFAAGAARTLGTAGLFVFAGVSWAEFHVAHPAPAALSGQVTAGQTTYAPASMATQDPATDSEPGGAEGRGPRAPRVWLVDGFNVLHAALLGGRDRSRWWTDDKRRELLELARQFDDRDAELWVVFDGDREPYGTDRSTAPNPSDEPKASWEPQCVFAPSADEWLIERVKSASDPTQIAVVTADRRVASRARGRGAQVFSPREFRARCSS